MDHDVAIAASEVGTRGEVGLVPCVVTFFGDAILGVGFDAFEIGLVNEVHNTGDRVRTVKRRSATGKDVNAFDELRRDHVKVDRGRTCNAADDPTAVDQNQRTVGAEVAKVDRGNTGTRGKESRVGAAEGGRAENGVFEQHFLNVGNTGIIDNLAIDDLERRGRLDRGRGDTRTGDDDGVAGCGGGFDLLVDDAVISILSENGGGNGEGCDPCACEERKTPAPQKRGCMGHLYSLICDRALVHSAH